MKLLTATPMNLRRGDLVVLVKRALCYDWTSIDIGSVGRVKNPKVKKEHIVKGPDRDAFPYFCLIEIPTGKGKWNYVGVNFCCIKKISKDS